MQIFRRLRWIFAQTRRFFFPQKDWWSRYSARVHQGTVTWQNQKPDGTTISTIPFPLEWHVVAWTAAPPGYALLAATDERTGNVIPPEHALRCVRCGVACDDRHLPLKDAADPPICSWCRPVVKLLAAYY